MEKHEFSPKITLDRGLKGPIEIDVKHIKTVGPNAIAGSDVTLENPGFCLIPSAIHVVESPWRIAVLIGEAVDSWIWSIRRAEDEQKEQKRQETSPIETPGPQHKEHNKPQNVAFGHRHAPENAVLDGDGWPVCEGPYGSPSYAEAVGKALVLTPEVLGVSEAGDSRVKLATGTGTVSMAKLREVLGGLAQGSPEAQAALKAQGLEIPGKDATRSAFGGYTPPTGKCSFCGGAHSSEDHTALGYLGYTVPAPNPEPPKDRLREALGAFASKLIWHPGRPATLLDIENAIIWALRHDGMVTLDAKGTTVETRRGH